MSVHMRDCTGQAVGWRMCALCFCLSIPLLIIIDIFSLLNFTFRLINTHEVFCEIVDFFGFDMCSKPIMVLVKNCPEKQKLLEVATKPQKVARNRDRPPRSRPPPPPEYSYALY